MAIDFFGVRLQGRIREYAPSTGKGPGKVVELWIDPQESALSDRETLGALAFVSEINIRIVLSDNTTMSMVLTPPLEEGLTFLQTELIRFGVGQLEIEIGYTTGTTSGDGAIQQTVLPFSGLLQYPDVSIGSDIGITLKAQGVGYALNVVGGAETEQFPEDSSYADAVQLTLNKYVSTDGSSSGLVIKNLYTYVDPEKRDPITGDVFFRKPQSRTVSEGKSNKPDAKATPVIIDKGPRNDWWFVKETIENFGYDFVIMGNELFVMEKTSFFYNLFLKDRPRKNFILRGAVDPTQNIFPILSFSSKSTGMYSQPGVGRMYQSDVDPNKKNDQGVTESAGPSNTPIGRGKPSDDFGPTPNLPNSPSDLDADIKAADAKEKSDLENASWIQIMSGDPNNPEDLAKMRAHWMDKNLQSGFEVSVTTIGIPDLMPGEVIDISGFEPFTKFPSKEIALFNGPYGVMEVNHKIGVGGWETSFLATMNTFPKQMQEAASKVNEEKAKQENDENDRMIGILVNRQQEADKNKQILPSKKNPSDIPKKSGTRIVSPKKGD